MTRKDASKQPKAGTRRRWLSIGAVVLAASTVVGAVHWFTDVDHVDAQPPRRGAATARSASAARPAAQGRATRSQGAGQNEIREHVIPDVVAVVNGEKITKEELAKACLWRYGEEVLEAMINKQLILQECRRKGITVTDSEVEDEIARVAHKFGMSPDRWLTMLKKERDIPPEKYRREIIWPTLALQKLAATEIEVSPQEIRQAFESEFGPKVRVRLIAVSSRKKAEEVLQKAKADPKQFGRLAKEYSEDSSAPLMGVVPPIRRHMGVPQLEAAAFRLEEGEVSDIIQVDDRYIILQCERHIPPTYIDERYRKDAEQRLADQIRDNKLRTVASQLFRKLQDQAKVVNVYNDPKLRQQMPGVAATINGQPIPISVLAEECMVRHGNEVLSGEIHRRLLQQALRKAGRKVEQSDIDAEIARAAASFGFLTKDGRPDVAAWLKKVQEEDGATIDLYVYDVVWPTVALKKLVPSKIEVTEKDLQRAFEANYGPRVEALAIVLGSQRTAQRVWELARSNPTDQWFGELARQYSIDPVSRSNMGQIPPIRKYGGRPMIEKEAFSLKPGEMSGIIATGDEFVILRCLGRTKPVIEKMDETVRRELESSLREQKLRRAMAARFNQLKEQARIENYLAGSLQIPRSPRAAAGTTRRR